MTRQNDIFSETFAIEIKNQSVSLFKMWCENRYFLFLGRIVHDCYENDYIQKQREYFNKNLVNGT